MLQTNPQQQEVSNLAGLEAHIVKMRLIHGGKCLQDQDFKVTWRTTIAAQWTVRRFNDALFNVKKTNPDYAVLELLKHEIRTLEKEMAAKDV